MLGVNRAFVSSVVRVFQTLGGNSYESRIRRLGHHGASASPQHQESRVRIGGVGAPQAIHAAAARCRGCRLCQSGRSGGCLRCDVRHGGRHTGRRAGDPGAGWHYRRRKARLGRGGHEHDLAPGYARNCQEARRKKYRDAGCPGLRGRYRRDQRHAVDHGRRQAGGVRQGQTAVRMHGQEHRAYRRQWRRTGG